MSEIKLTDPTELLKSAGYSVDSNPPSGDSKHFLQKGVDAIGYALYNATAIFNHPGQRYCPCYVSLKKH